MSGMMISRRDIDAALDRARSLWSTAEKHRGTGESVATVAGSQALSGLAAFGYGMLVGNKGTVKVGPVEADALVGFGLHLGGIFGLFGKGAGYAHNFGQGLVDSFLHRQGIGLGYAMAKAGTTAPNVADPKGSFHVGGERHSMSSSAYVSGRQRPLTVADVAAIVQQHR